MENIQYFMALLAALVVGVFLIKKITGCIFRIVIAVIMLAIIGWALTVLHLL
ncbi:MAG: hypothetical protein ACFNM8_02745 [Prevotella histicola]|uniref:hypothetical protein n=1 Tax=Prevotella histicola TaxID=470565 RepID=UPI001CB233C6|nr:hypothetical protein [Prevotella histicola]MBF1403785.1 hypothetical protein [Prevotella histicola]